MPHPALSTLFTPPILDERPTHRRVPIDGDVRVGARSFGFFAVREMEAVGRAIGGGGVGEETGGGFERAFLAQEERAEGDFVRVVDVATG